MKKGYKHKGFGSSALTMHKQSQPENPTRKFQITTSDCCGTEARLSVGVLSQRFDKDFTCSKCGKLCKIKTIPCTSDEDIAEVLKKLKLGNIEKGIIIGNAELMQMITDNQSMLADFIAKQLNITL